MHARLLRWTPDLAFPQFQWSNFPKVWRARQTALLDDNLFIAQIGSDLFESWRARLPERDHRRTALYSPTLRGEIPPRRSRQASDTDFINDKTRLERLPVSVLGKKFNIIYRRRRISRVERSNLLAEVDDGPVLGPP